MNIRVAARLMTVVAVIVFTGCFVGRNVAAAQVDDQESRQQGQNKMEKKAADIGKKLDELEQKMKTTKEEAKADITQQMAELREMQKRVQEKLREMKSASGKAWQDAKDGAQSTMNDLQKAYEKARSRFTSTGE